jgi:outer membrane receptor protein involved in Fe transport
VPLPRQSEHIGNLSVGYEKYGISARLAATYRSEYLDEVNEIDEPLADRYIDDHLQLDFTAKYRFLPEWQVYLNVINITDEPLYAYFSEPRYNSQYEEYGITTELGIRANF